MHPQSSDPAHGSTPRSHSSNLGPIVGPCYLKVLVSNIVAGSIIGQKGGTIASISSKTGCTIRLSHSGCYFPGTIERVVAMWGTLEQIKAAFLIVLEKIRDAPAGSETQSVSPGSRASGTAASGRMVSKIVVPNSAVSQLIGKQGQTIKELQETTGTRIQVSNRDEHHFKERVVIVTGSFDSVCRASLDVMETIQSDPHIKDHTEINYVVSVPIVLPQYMTNNPSATAGLFPASPGMMAGGPNVPLTTQNEIMRSMLQMNQNTTAAAAGGYFPFFAQHGINPNNERMLVHGSYVSPSGSRIPTSVSAGQATVTAHLDVPDNFVGFTIGKQGATLQVIQQQSGAKLHVSSKGDYVPGTENRRVTITGPPGSVQMAQALLQQKLREIEELASQRGLPINGGLGSVGHHHGHGGIQSAFPS